MSFVFCFSGFVKGGALELMALGYNPSVTMKDLTSDDLITIIKVSK